MAQVVYGDEINGTVGVTIDGVYRGHIKDDGMGLDGEENFVELSASLNDSLDGRLTGAEWHNGDSLRHLIQSLADDVYGS